MTSNGTVVCKDNPRKCEIFWNGEWYPYEPVDLITNAAIDQTIHLWRSGLRENASNYLNSMVDNITRAAPQMFPFPSPLPRDFTNQDITEADFPRAAEEFEKAANATRDVQLSALFRTQIEKLRN
jgi:hypothetical protein